MKIRGVEFPGAIIDSALNFDGHGYPHHKYFRLMFGKKFGHEGATFAAKTITLSAQEGRLPLCEDGMTPKEMFPECIKVYPKTGEVLNDVKHSNRGLDFYLGREIWMDIVQNFFVSASSDAGTRLERLVEWKGIAKLLSRYFPSLKCQAGLVISPACPNIDAHNNHKDEHEFVDEVLGILDVLDHLKIPKVVKVGISLSGDGARKIADHRNCDALQVTNAVKWGSPLIDWNKRFGTNRSPLARHGEGDKVGGYSGPLLLPLLIDWLKNNRHLVDKPVIAGGGMTSWRDVRRVAQVVRPDGYAFSSIMIVRPWLVQETVDEANYMAK